jgi:hypothetical protein
MLTQKGISRALGFVEKTLDQSVGSMTAAERCEIAAMMLAGLQTQLRFLGGNPNGHPKLDAAQVAEIRQRNAAGESQQSLAREYGVSHTYSWLTSITSR